MPTEKQVQEFVQVLQHFDLFQDAEQYKIICPFHGDKNASLQINVPKCFWYCYGCGEHGGTIELFKQLYKLRYKKEISDLQASLSIKQIVKGSAKKFSVDNTQFVPSSKNKLEQTKLARQYYYSLPTPNWYRPSKNESIIEETRSCLSYMRKRGFSAYTLTKCGAKPSLNKYYPITIPLLENGIFRGYVQRTFDKEIEQQRKYMYNRGFCRERTLAGNYGPDTVLVVEGYLDCLKAQQLGVKYTVAILGWKISAHQLNKLKNKGITRIICGLDNDDAGRKGYRYLKRISKQQGWFTVVRLHYPKGTKDIGEIQKGTDKAQKVLDQVTKFFC